MTGQDGFAAALLDPERPVPEGLSDPQGRPAGKRFDVYRNNVAVSLTEALETGFPVVRKLVGDDFFKALAGVYLRSYPPATPLIMHFGAEMPVFLESFPPVAELPYLPDVARLELALRRAYHAADAPAFDATVLQSLSLDALMAARLQFAPAVKLLSSKFPVQQIWLANTRDDAPTPSGGCEYILLTRPEFDPSVDPLSPDAFAFIEALMQNAPFATAVSTAEAVNSDHDLGATLSLLLSRNAITNLTEGPPHAPIDFPSQRGL